jgi:hypothetical protein
VLRIDISALAGSLPAVSSGKTKHGAVTKITGLGSGADPRRVTVKSRALAYRGDLGELRLMNQQAIKTGLDKPSKIAVVFQDAPSCRVNMAASCIGQATERLCFGSFGGS